MDSNRGTLALAAPAVPMYALIMPLAVFIPSYYAREMGLGMATVGMMLAGARVFDVVTDPLAGVLMDRFQERVSRAGWVAIGGIPVAIATSLLFFATPPGDPVAFMATLLLLYVGWTFMSVGLFSWAGETSTEYDGRARVMGIVQLASSVGTVAALMVPAAVELLGSEAQHVARDRVQALGVLILVLLPPSLALALFRGPKSIQRRPSPTSVSLFRIVAEAMRQPAMRRLLAADLAAGLNLGIATSVSVFFIEIVLGHPGRAGVIQLLTIGAGMLAVPVWVRIARDLEKHNAFAITAVFTLLGGLFALWVPAGEFGLYVAGGCLLGLATSGAQFLPRSIMADLVDADRLESGEERTGIYFALLTTTLKLGLAGGIAFAFLAADWAGFDPVAAREDASAHFSIRAITGFSSVALGAAMIALMWKFPFGRAEQQAAQAQIDGRTHAASQK